MDQETARIYIKLSAPHLPSEVGKRWAWSNDMFRLFLSCLELSYWAPACIETIDGTQLDAGPLGDLCDRYNITIPPMSHHRAAWENRSLRMIRFDLRETRVLKTD